MAITFKGFLRKRSNKSTYGTIYVRVTNNREHVYFNTLETLEECFWNKKKGRVSATHPNHIALNDIIQISINNLHSKLLAERLSGKPVDTELLKSTVRPFVAVHSFLDLKNEYVESVKMSFDRVKHYKTTFKKWEALKLPDDILQIKKSHLITFKASLGEAAQNSILAHFNRLNAILNYAVEKEIIIKNPLGKMKLGAWETKTSFLSMAEIRLLQDKVPELPKELQQVGWTFLLQCFTGVRFGNLMNIQDGVLEKGEQTTYLKFTDHKTKKQNRLPLLPQAEYILMNKQGKKYTNQYYNRAIKEVAKIAGINQPVTSHIARHTFATIGLNKGIRMEVMQKLLGHGKIETTLIYARLMDNTIAQELLKWNG